MYVLQKLSTIKGPWYYISSRKNTAFDLWMGNKLRSVISLYRSPNQWYDGFVSFLDNFEFELTLDTLAQNNPFLMVALMLSPAIGIIMISLVMKAKKLKQ